MKNYIAISMFLILFLSGCGYKTGVTTPDQKSYLYFSGDTQGVYVSVDNSEKFTVKSGRDHQYAIEPGKHKIHVYRNDNLIIEREVYISDGVAKEIEVQ